MWTFFGIRPTDKPTGIDILESQFSPQKMGRAFTRFLYGQRRLGGPDMPGRQPCPECHGWRKRDRKTKVGAFYICSPCDSEFFVIHQAAALADYGKITAGAI